MLGQVASLDFGLLSERDVLDNSHVQVVLPTSFDASGTPIAGGLMDPRMGSCSPDYNCTTCHLRRDACQNHWGHIELVQPIIWPVYIDPVIKTLRCTCFFCSRILLPKCATEQWQSLLKSNRSVQQRLAAVLKHCKNIKHCCERDIGARWSAQDSAMAFQSKLVTLASDEVGAAARARSMPCGHAQPTYTQLGSIIQVQFPSLPGKYFVLPPARIRDIFAAMSDDDVEALGYHSKRSGPKHMITTCIPVPPPALRPAGSAQEYGGNSGTHAYTTLLGNIVKCNDTAKDLLSGEVVPTPGAPTNATGARQRRMEGFMAAAKVVQWTAESGAALCTEALQFAAYFWAVMIIGDKAPVATAAAYTVGGGGGGRNKRQGSGSGSAVAMTRPVRPGGPAALDVSGVPTARQATSSGGASRGSSTQSGFVSLEKRLKGKHGRFRGNLAAKRVNFTARAVATPDESLAIDQVGIPIETAMKWTYKVLVTQHNYLEMQRLVCNGPDIWPGANYVKQKSSHGYKLDLRYVKNRAGMTLCYGDAVYRHILDGDFIVVNRQPSLHKYSWLGGRVKVGQYDTVALNNSWLKNINGDYDGDEINIHCPQSIQARAEIKYTSMLVDNLNSAQTGRTSAALIQDHLMGIFLATHKDVFFSREQVQHLLMQCYNADKLDVDAAFCITGADGLPINKAMVARKRREMDEQFSLLLANLPEPAILKPQRLWTGKQLLSALIPKTVSVNMYGNAHKILKGAWTPPIGCNTPEDIVMACPTDTYVYIVNGELLAGQLDSRNTAADNVGSVLQAIINDCGSEAGARFLNYCQKIANEYLSSHALSVSIEDLMVPQAIYKQMDRVKSEASASAQNIASAGKPAAAADAFSFHTYKPPNATIEATISQKVGFARDTATETGAAHMNKDNGFKKMLAGGSKGGLLNFAQMVFTIGQQTIDGRSVRSNGMGRTLPSFAPGDESPEAHGTIWSSYFGGMSVTEKWFHDMAGRIGLIDTSTKTAIGGYLTRRLVAVLGDVMARQDGSVRNEKDRIMQIFYGNDGFECSKVEYIPAPWMQWTPTAITVCTRWPVPMAAAVVASPLLEVFDGLAEDLYLQQFVADRTSVRKGDWVVHASELEPRLSTPFVLERLVDHARMNANAEATRWTVDMHPDFPDSCRTLVHLSFVRRLSELLLAAQGPLDQEQLVIAAMGNHPIHGAEALMTYRACMHCWSMASAEIASHVHALIFGLMRMEASWASSPCIPSWPDILLALKKLRGPATKQNRANLLRVALKRRSMLPLLAYIQTELNSKRVLLKHGLSLPALAWLVNRVYEMVHRARVDNKEAVGHVCAQSNSERALQQTLRAFHTVGVAGKSTTQGLVRNDELYNVTRVPRSPRVTFCLRAPLCYNQQQTFAVADSFVRLSFAEIIDLSQQQQRRRPEAGLLHHSNGVLEDLERMDSLVTILAVKDLLGNVSHPLKVKKVSEMLSENVCDWHIRIKIRNDALGKHGAGVGVAGSVAHKIRQCKNIAGRLPVLSGTGPTAKRMGLWCYPIPSDNVVVLRCFVPRQLMSSVASARNNKADDAHCIASLLDLALHLLDPRTLVQGSPNIENATLEQQKGKDGLTKWYATTYGTDLPMVLSHPSVEVRSVSGNDPLAMLGTGGIFSAQKVLQREIERVVDFGGGGGVLPQHTDLVATVMCHYGFIMPANRWGVNRLPSGALARASFEQTKDVLQNAALSAQTDHLQGLTEHIIVGRIPPVGTGAVQLISNGGQNLPAASEAQIREGFQRAHTAPIHGQRRRTAAPPRTPTIAAAAPPVPHSEASSDPELVLDEEPEAAVEEHSDGDDDDQDDDDESDEEEESDEEGDNEDVSHDDHEDPGMVDDVPAEFEEEDAMDLD